MSVTHIQGEQRRRSSVWQWIRSFFFTDLTLPQLGSKTQASAIEKIDNRIVELERQVTELQELRLGLEHYDDIQRTVQLTEKYL